MVSGVVADAGRRRGERVRQGGQGMQSRAQALDGPGALLTTQWAAYRREFDSRWQPRVVHTSKHTSGCPARNLFRHSAWSLESVMEVKLKKLKKFNDHLQQDSKPVSYII